MATPSSPLNWGHLTVKCPQLNTLDLAVRPPGVLPPFDFTAGTLKLLDREWRPRSSASPQVEHNRWKLNLECRPFPGFAVHGRRLAWLGFAWLQELPFGFSHLPYTR